MSSMFDVELYDAELDHEIGLLSELMVIASDAGEPLDRAAIDALLGVERATVPRQRLAG